MSGKDLRETAGLLLVVASLVFVGWEIRQNTLVAQAAAYQEIGFTTMEGWRIRSLDRAYAELTVLANDSSRWDEIDEAGWLQLRWSALGSMRGWETVYSQVQAGLLPQEAMARFGYDVSPAEYWPNFDQTWQELRPLLSEGFAQYMEREFDLGR